MNIEQFMKLASDMRKKANTNLTIGTMLKELDKFNDNAIVKIDNNGLEEFKTYVTDLFSDDKEQLEKDYYKNLFNVKDIFLDLSFDSYRGYYEDMYLGITYEETSVTVKDLKDLLNNAKEVGKMVGYKGGDFSINDDTILWLDEYGNCKGIAPISFYKISYNEILLLTKRRN